MATETALITGASSGIGLEFAKRFAADRSNLVLVARRRERLEQLAEQLRQEHRIDVTVLVQDLTEADGPAQVERQLLEAGISVDVLVNNAGFGELGPLYDLPLDRQMRMVQLNVTALTELTRRFLPGMMQRGRGGVLNVASTAAFQPGPKMAVYFASKAYVLSFTEAVAEEIRNSSITVTCLCPGPTHTEFGAESGVDKSFLFRLGPWQAETVVRIGYRAFRNGRTVIIPGWINWLVTLLIRFTPRVLVRRVCAGLLSRV